MTSANVYALEKFQSYTVFQSCALTPSVIPEGAGRGGEGWRSVIAGVGAGMLIIL